MKYAAIAMVTAFIVFGNGLPASAQTAIGGPKKQTPVGGAARQNSPVLPPASKTASVPPPAINPPARPVSKPVSVAAVSPKHLKCAAGACVMKGPRGPK